MSNCQSTKPVKVVISLGLLALALIHACSVVTFDRVVPAFETLILDKSDTVTPSAPAGGINYDSTRFGPMNILPVNDAARDEIKKQLFRRPVPSTNLRPPPSAICPDCPPPQNPRPAPSPGPPATGETKPVKVSPRYSIELFLSSDSVSQSLRQWFETHETLKRWRQSCNYNEYTPDNGLYRGRYADLIPVAAFPVVLVTGPDGGHVYVTEKNKMPASAAELVTAISEATKLYQSIQQQLTQPLPLVGPPTQSTAASHPPPDWTEDCSGGNCPPDRLGFLRPNRDSPSNVPQVESLLRWIVRPVDSSATLLLAVCVTAFVIYLLKRNT